MGCFSIDKIIKCVYLNDEIQYTKLLLTENYSGE